MAEDKFYTVLKCNNRRVSRLSGRKGLSHSAEGSFFYPHSPGQCLSFLALPDILKEWFPWLYMFPLYIQSSTQNLPLVRSPWLLSPSSNGLFGCHSAFDSWGGSCRFFTVLPGFLQHLSLSLPCLLLLACSGLTFPSLSSLWISLNVLESPSLVHRSDDVTCLPDVPPLFLQCTHASHQPQEKAQPDPIMAPAPWKTRCFLNTVGFSKPLLFPSSWTTLPIFFPQKLLSPERLCLTSCWGPQGSLFPHWLPHQPPSSLKAGRQGQWPIHLCSPSTAPDEGSQNCFFKFLNE